MDLASLNEAELINLRDKLQTLHTGSSLKTFTIGEKDNATMFSVVQIEDKRLNDLLWIFLIEVHNKLCSRFSERTHIQLLPPR